MPRNPIVRAAIAAPKRNAGAHQDERRKERRWFLNHYRHEDCEVDPGVEWQDEWSCMCNDRCPACNAEIEPYTSEEIR